MATYINLQFNDNVNIELSTSSFLYKQSTFLQAFDLNDDTTLRSGASSSPITLDEGFASAGNVIPILCPSSYVLDEHGHFYFNDKTDLSFMYTILPNNYLEICKFLDIICYENEDNIFSKQFIIYVMEYIKKKISIIQYFMQLEIKSILNYINKIDIDIQIRTCTPEFYFLYLTKYKEDVAHAQSTNVTTTLLPALLVFDLVIKHNRIDIYELSQNKNEYYRYIHKYDNQTTYQIKQEQEYNNYVIDISTQLIIECKNQNNINNIIQLIEQGANINLQDNEGNTALHIELRQNDNVKVIKYLVEQGANVNLQDTLGYTALHIASYQLNNLEVVKYLVEQGANINLQNNNGSTALHYASYKLNNLEVIKYLVEQGANIHLQNNGGYTALHKASIQKNNLEVIKYLVEQGANIHLQTNDGETALYFASLKNNNLEVIEYLRLLS